MNQKILVVVPMYNSEKTIELAISSILEQSHKNILLTIVDDCSTDDSLAIAQKFLSDPRVSIYKLNKNMGAYAARNFGLFINKDEDWDFFTTHDADDISLRFRLRELLQAFRPKVLGVQDVFERRELYTEKSLGQSITMAHAIFKREAFEKVGYFDSSTRFAADWEYWQRIKIYASQNQMTTAAVNKKVGISYVHGENLTVLVPIGSKPRVDYVERATAKLEKIKETKKYYEKFNIAKDGHTRITKKTNVQNGKRYPKASIVLLTWKRLHTLKSTLNRLSKQTYSDFDVHISNANLANSARIDRIVEMFSDKVSITVSHDGNDYYSFRRLFVAKNLAEQGSEVIIFLDDDVEISAEFVSQCLRNYAPKSYMSWYAWSFNGSIDYFDRTRVQSNGQKVHYGGAGISIIDSSFFIKNRKLFKVPNKNVYKIEDLWLSYCVSTRDGWQIKHLPLSNIYLGGADGVALHKEVQSGDYTKTDLLKELVAMGWDIQN
jgi:glycosyltransferase involved in cell wall biosynthesis